MEDYVARTEYSKRIERIEDNIARVGEADDSFRMIAARTDDPAIISEVKRGRGSLRSLWSDLVSQRNEKKEHPYDDFT